MLVDTLITVAFKNSFEQYNLRRISVFEITNIDLYFNIIECKKINKKELKILIKCPICGENHSYTYKFNDFIKRSMVIGGCEKLGLPVFYIGNREKVEEKINKYKEIRKEIYAMI